jgi:nucleosome binding factor SPN SPT16 subunit
LCIVVQTDVGIGVGLMLSTKDTAALRNVRKAAEFSEKVLKDFLLSDIESILDEERKVTHSALADSTEECFNNPTKLAKVSLQRSGRSQPNAERSSAIIERLIATISVVRVCVLCCAALWRAVQLKGENLESCFTPIIQSGGKYDLKVSATSNGDVLHPGCITVSLGARYKGYWYVCRLLPPLRSLRLSLARDRLRDCVCGDLCRCD